MPPPPMMDLMSRTLQASSSKPRPSIPLARRRMQPEQLQALQTLYDVNTHPSKAQRTQLARELGLDLKAVNIWYQNKRRSMKKKLAAWRDAENTSRSSSAASLAEPKTNPVLRRNPSYTLDSVASSRERRDNRPPLRPRHHVPNYADDLHDDYDDYDDLGIPENIYELIPSSPPQPPSSPGAECVFLSGLPPDSKTMRSLEWACAKDRAVRRKRVKERRRRRGEENADVPELDLDEGLSSEADFDDLITPDTSLQSIAAGLLKPSPRKPKTKAGDGRARADEEAAHVLLAFRRA